MALSIGISILKRSKNIQHTTKVLEQFTNLILPELPLAETSDEAIRKSRNFASTYENSTVAGETLRHLLNLYEFLCFVNTNEEYSQNLEKMKVIVFSVIVEKFGDERAGLLLAIEQGSMDDAKDAFALYASKYMENEIEESPVVIARYLARLINNKDVEEISHIIKYISLAPKFLKVLIFELVKIIGKETVVKSVKKKINNVFVPQNEDDELGLSFEEQFKGLIEFLTSDSVNYLGSMEHEENGQAFPLHAQV